MPLARVGGAKAAPWHAAERYAMLPSRHSFVIAGGSSNG